MISGSSCKLARFRGCLWQINCSIFKILLTEFPYSLTITWCISRSNFCRMVFQNRHIAIHTGQYTIRPSPEKYSLCTDSQFLLFRRILDINTFVYHINDSIGPVDQLEQIIIPMTCISTFSPERNRVLL